MVLSAHEIDAQVRKAAFLISRWPGVRRVWLFGSAAQGKQLDWRSDLDFAVEGLAASDWPRAWNELDEQLMLPVDLVQWESATPALREQITGRGTIIYEA
jgi:predicted nucleotidyltransferase